MHCSLRVHGHKQGADGLGGATCIEKALQDSGVCVVHEDLDQLHTYRHNVDTCIERAPQDSGARLL